jgi:N-acetylmuramoyl-L-alanine amidase
MFVRSHTAWIALCTFLLLGLTVVSVHASPRHVPSFDETSAALARLSKSRATARDQWLQVIGDFARIYKEGKDGSKRTMSLFLAGKASLGLYRRSGRIEDLDVAIRYLKDLAWVNRSGPDRTRGMTELKKALALRSKIEQEKARRHASRERNSSRNHKTDSGRPSEESWALPATQPKKPQAENPGPPTQQTRSPHGPVAPEPAGNPFCPAGTFNLIAAAIPVRPVSAIPKKPIEPPSAAIPPIRPKKAFVVVIDPGHGGKDPGAVSPDGLLKEKDVTLGIARRLGQIFENAYPHIKVVLTREDDRFMSIEERTARANDVNADIFLSIHCNSSTDSSSHGVETYYLSSAASQREMEVAARENGVPLERMSDLEATVVDLSVTSKRVESDRLAAIVHRCVTQKLASGNPQVEDRGVRRAPFSVLSGVGMPAILVECAFMSNSGDREKLQDPTYLQHLAQEIAKGAETYLRDPSNKG